MRLSSKDALTGIVAFSLITSAMTVAHTGLTGLLGSALLLTWYIYLTD